MMPINQPEPLRILEGLYVFIYKKFHFASHIEYKPFVAKIFE